MRPYNIGRNKWVYATDYTPQDLSQITDLSLLATQLEVQNLYGRVLLENFIDNTSLLTNEYTNLTYLSTLNSKRSVLQEQSLSTGQAMPALDDSSNFAGNLLLINNPATLHIKKGLINLYFLEQVQKKETTQNLLFKSQVFDIIGAEVEKA